MELTYRISKMDLRLPVPPPPVLILMTVLLSQSSSEQQEYCQTEMFQANCARDEVIHVQSAQYGRMNIGRCVQTDYGHVGCQADVLKFSDRRCSGRHRCEIRIPDAAFEATKPCPVEFKTYFSTMYECLKVATPEQHGCPMTDHITLTGMSGYIANLITEETEYGSLSCPWRIVLPVGQRINITLLDFATPMDDNYPLADTGICYQYAIVTEKSSTTRNVRVCGGAARVRHVYTSRTNSVEVRVITRDNVDEQTTSSLNYFALKWEAIGCPEVTAPALGWKRYSEDGTSLLMGCNTSNRQWTLVCHSNRWTGPPAENCTKAEQQVAGMQWGSISLPYGVSVGIISGLALIVGVIILLVGLICMEWKKMRRHASELPTIAGAVTSEHELHKADHENGGAKRNNFSPDHKNNTLKRTNIDKVRDQQLPPLQQQQLATCQQLDDGGGIPGVDINKDDDLVRELWPMAPPPGIISGTSTYPRRANKLNDKNTNYGVSSNNHQATIGRPKSVVNGCGVNDNDEDDVLLQQPIINRHIYDTPKAMRKLDNGPKYFELSSGRTLGKHFMDDELSPGEENLDNMNRHS